MGRLLSWGYLGLFLLDAVLSIVDNIGAVRHHYSTWSTTALCLLSPVAFLLAIVLTVRKTLQPKWPLFVGSGFYCVLLSSLTIGMAVLAVAQGESGALLSESSWRVVNLVGASIQLALGMFCLRPLVRPPESA